MAVVIRMQRKGTTNKAFFRIVVADKGAKRDGKFIERLGHYDPLKEKDNVTIDKERALYWLSVGAQVSENVKPIFKREGIRLAVEPKPKKVKEKKEKVKKQVS